MATTYLNLAIVQTDHLFVFKSAETNYLKSIEIREQLLKSDFEWPLFDDYKNNSVLKNDLATTYSYLAHCYESQHKHIEAVTAINKAIDIAKELLKTDSKYLIDWINHKQTLAGFYFSINEIESAKSILSEIKPQAEKCLAENPDDNLTKSVNNDINELLAKINQRQ